MRRLLTALCIAGAGFVHAQELPDGWYPIGDGDKTGYEVSVVEGAGANGAGLLVRKLDSGSDTFGGVGQMISAEQFRGKKVRMSGYLKTNNVSDGYAGLWFRVDRERKVLVLDNMDNRGVTATTDWRQYETVVEVDETATRILFGALLTGSGELYADDFALIVVPDETPTTRNALPLKPRNLGFD